VHRIRATFGIGLVTAGLAASVVMSAPAGATKSHGDSPKTVVAGVKSDTMAAGWTPFAAILPYKPAVAGETSTNGALGVAYFAFPSAKDAAAFVKKPSTLAVVQARNAVPIAYSYAAQEGFSNQKLVDESRVFTFSGGVAIFLQQGTTVVLGTYLGAAPASGAGYDLEGIGLSAATQEAATFLTAKPSATKTTTPATLTGFSGIDNNALPGLPASNWPTVADAGSPPAAMAAASATSNDDDYTISLYDFSTPAAAEVFYNAPPGAMPSFLGGALGYAPLSGSTGVPGQSRGVDLRSCAGEGSGPSLLASGSCSNGGASFSVGVGTIVLVGSVVMMVGYVTTNNAASANPADLAKNTKVALSGVKLLNSLGISQ
jgi:hypothetical protein